MDLLKQDLIRLGSEDPALRGHLEPILDYLTKVSKLLHPHEPQHLIEFMEKGLRQEGVNTEIYCYNKDGPTNEFEIVFDKSLSVQDSSSGLEDFLINSDLFLGVEEKENDIFTCDLGGVKARIDLTSGEDGKAYADMKVHVDSAY